MPGFKLVKKLSGGPESTLSRIFQPLADSFFCVGLSGNVRHALRFFAFLPNPYFAHFPPGHRLFSSQMYSKIPI